jgi:hypothetical protein
VSGQCEVRGWREGRQVISPQAHESRDEETAGAPKRAKFVSVQVAEVGHEKR